MSTENTFLKIISGNVILYNRNAQPILRYYTRGDAFRADWFDKANESIEVLTTKGEVLIISKACQIIKRI